MTITKECFQTSYATLSQIFPSIKKDLESKSAQEQQAELHLRYLLLDSELDDHALETATKLMCIKCDKLYPGDNWSAKLIAYANPTIAEEWPDVVRAIRENISGANARYDPEGFSKKLKIMRDQCPLSYILAQKLGFEYCASNINSEICISQIRMACEAEKNRAEKLGGYIEKYEDVGKSVRVGELQKLNIGPALRLLESIKDENS